MTIGGMQRHAYYMALTLAQNGWQVDIVLPDELNQQKFVDQFPKELASQVQLFGIPYTRSKRPFSYVQDEIRYSKRIFEWLKGRNFSEYRAILTKGFTPSAWNKEEVETFPRVISQLHGLEMFQKTFDFRSNMAARSLRSIARKTLNNADVILSYGGKIKELHQQVMGAGANLVTFHGGLLEKDMVAEPGSIHQPVRLLFIGRNERRKGIPELLAILGPLLEDAEYDFEMHWIGVLDEKMIPAHPRFHYHGQISQLATYFELVDGSDILLLPSISEGFPTVLPECMGRGLSSVAMDVGAVNQLVNNETGWLAQDHKQFEEVLKQVLKTAPDQIQQKKQKALKKVEEEFTWNRLGVRLIGILDEEVQ